MKGKHAQKNFNAVGAMAPTPLSLKTTLGGGGGWGVSHTRTGPGRPPVVSPLCRLHKHSVPALEPTQCQLYYRKSMVGNISNTPGLDSIHVNIHANTACSHPVGERPLLAMTKSCSLFAFTDFRKGLWNPQSYE